MRTCSSPGPTTGFSTRRKVPGLVISTALYVFPIFVSCRSGRTHVSSCIRSWSQTYRIILEVSILVLIESAAVWRFCWALVGGKRERRALLLFRRGEVERLRHRCVCSSPPSWRSSNNLTEASIESWLVSESDVQRDC